MRRRLRGSLSGHLNDFVELLSGMPDSQRPGAKDTHADVFGRLDVIVEKVHNWLHGSPRPAPTALDNLRVAFVVRALNQYRAILNLLKTNHWEDALILTRSLFELLLNVEEVIHRQKDKEAAAQRFFLFSELQSVLEWLELQRYQVASGRLPDTHARILDATEKAARKLFAPFAYTDKKGRPRWRTHWADKTVADLCDLSPNKIRPHQYRTLYAKGSAFTHSAPMAVLSAHHRDPGTWEEFLAASDAQEDRDLRLAASFATLFLGEILVLVGNQLPEFRREWVVEVLLPTVSSIIVERKG